VGSYPTVSPLPDAQGVLILESEESGGLLSVALSVGLPRPAVSWHPALWSPDFPQALGSARDRAPHPTSSNLPPIVQRLERYP
jgi:hypothetical protein